MAVEVLGVGDATTTTLSYSVNGGAPTLVQGLIEFDIENIGPFTVGDDVAVFLNHEFDGGCNRNLGTFTDNGTCPPLSENCLGAQNLVSLPNPYSSTTVGYVDDLSSYPGGCQSNASPDRIFFIDVPNGFTLQIGQTVNGYDSENYVGYGGSCPGATQIACYDDSDIQNITWTNTTGSTQRVYWVQDGYFNASNAGTFTLAWSLIAPCTGTPAPGATLSTAASACPLTNFTLSLSAPPTDLGITFQWFREHGFGFGTLDACFGSQQPYADHDQSVQSWYYCAATCVTGPSTGNSTPVQVDINNDPIACLCTPTYTIGKTDGDLISNVVITGTTLSNNSGTAPVNPAYTYFNTLPNHTGTLQAGTSYTIQVTVGTYGSQNVAVWIDFNENGVFEPVERVGFTSSSSRQQWHLHAEPALRPHTGSEAYAGSRCVRHCRQHHRPLYRLLLRRNGGLRCDHRASATLPRTCRTGRQHCNGDHRHPELERGLLRNRLGGRVGSQRLHLGLWYHGECVGDHHQPQRPDRCQHLSGIRLAPTAMRTA